MTAHKFTDDQVIRCLNQCKGTDFIVAHLVDGGKEEMISLQRLIDILNSQNEEIKRLTIDRNAARLGMIAEHERLNRARADVASEIFEEIEELAKIYTLPVIQKGIVEIEKEPFWCIEPSDLAELKKKYTNQP